MTRWWRSFFVDIQWQTRVTSQLTDILTRLEQIMDSETDLQTDLDAIQADAIATLSAAAPGVMTQAQLDALDAEAQAILATVPTTPATT